MLRPGNSCACYVTSVAERLRGSKRETCFIPLMGVNMMDFVERIRVSTGERYLTPPVGVNMSIVAEKLRDSAGET